MKEFIRNFSKQKIIGILNICSLSLGIMVAIVVGLWSINELSFDTFHKNKDKTYRLVQHLDFNNSRTKTGAVFKPIGEEAQSRFPQIEDMSRIITQGCNLKVGEKLYPDMEFSAVDANFFRFFSFELLEGDIETVLDAPDKVLLSENAVKQYFPNQNPIGEALEIDGYTLTVSGIFKIPKNSSLQADIITPFLSWMINSGWGDNDSFVTFLMLKKEDVSKTENEIKELIFEKMEIFKSANLEIELEALSEIHFSTGFLFDPIPKANKSLIYIFIVVALVILIISCINFTNLFVATSFLRARSVGIKKSQGGDKPSLIIDFYLETVFYTLFAIVLGIFLAYLALPVFNNFTQSNLTIDFASFSFYIFILILFIFTVFMAGTFPALYMTRFNPIETLSGKFKGKNISVFQKILLIVQFAASICLLIIVGFMNKQVDFMIGQDLGFNKENVIYVERKADFGANFEAFKERMLREPSIVDLTRKTSLPSDWRQGWPIRKQESDEDIVVEMNYVQENYFDFMKIKFVEGENPFYLESNDSINIYAVANERLIKVLDLENPINRILKTWNTADLEVKGVITDLKIQSFHNEVHPQIYLKMSDDWWHWVVFFKITGDPQRAIAHIRQEWESENPQYPFEYHYLDDTYEKLYTAEMNAGRVLSFAMLITFIISIAGLFAMAYYITQRRIREIGLRKVNGATLKDLLILLNKDFIVWVAISYLIAVPIAYFSLDMWLESFTVKTTLNFWLFFLVGLIAFVVTLLTTSLQTWKVANTNPVETLKNE